MNGIKPEYFVIFGGGGIRGVSYVGALKALIENEVKITGYAGSSIGSVFATLCAVGYDLEEIKELFYGISLDFFKDINFDFRNKIAISKGEVFLEWMREKLESKFYKENFKKGEMPPVRFCDLKDELVIYSVDITNNKYNEYSKTLTPEAEVALAVRASVSMPGLFKPLEIDNNLIVDGDLMKSWPLWRLSKTLSEKKERILEFRLEDNGVKREISNALDYINAVYNTISGFATDYIIDVYGKKDKFDYIKINTDGISVVDFMIDMKTKELMVHDGYDTTMDYFKNQLPLKKQNLYENYSKIQKITIDFKKYFDKGQVEKAKGQLYELFVYLCQNKRFIDLEVFKKLVEFEKNFSKNITKKNSFFALSKFEISNKSALRVELSEIIKILTVKVSEVTV